MNRPDLFLNTLIDKLRYRPSWDLRNHMINGIRRVQQGGIAAVALDLIHFGINRIQTTNLGVTGFQKRIVKTPHGPGTGIRADTDNGNGTGIEDRI